MGPRHERRAQVRAARPGQRCGIARVSEEICHARGVGRAGHEAERRWQSRGLSSGPQRTTS